MADYTANSDMTLEQAITNGSMVNGDILTIGSGAVVTCTETPSILFQEFDISSGEFLIDGPNISAGNNIAFPLEYNQDSNVRGRGKLTINGDWYYLSDTDGTNDQTLDLSTFYGGSFEDVVCGIWIETGRRIDFDGASGATPEVGDWVYKTADLDVLGRIVEVQSTYLVVKFLTGTFANNDPIQVRKIVDDKGPDFQITWTALVNNASGDILEAGIYQEFCNSRYNGANTLTYYGSKMSGFVFDHAFQSNTITLGGAAGGFIPPSGCKVRLSNVHLSTATSASFALGNTYHDGTTNEGTWHQWNFYYAGEFRCNKVNFGSFYAYVSQASVLEMYHVAAAVGIGGIKIGSKMILHNCIMMQSFASTGYGPGYANMSNINCPAGSEFIDCLTVSPGDSAHYSSGAYNTENVTIKDSIFVISSTSGSNSNGLRLAGSRNIVVDNVVVYGSMLTDSIYITSSSDITITRLKICSTAVGGQQADEEDLIWFQNVRDCTLIGLEILEGGLPGNNMLTFDNSGDIKVRGIGMIDEKIDFGTTDAELVISMANMTSNIDLARIWRTNIGTVEEFYNAGQQFEDIKITNCSTNYFSSTSSEMGAGFDVRGLHGGSANWGTTGGQQTSSGASYGFQIADFFRSDTQGCIWSMFRSKPVGGILLTDHNIVSESGIEWIKNGAVNFTGIGSTITLEQHYFSRGHTGFDGGFTATDGNNRTWGTDNYTSNIDVDFQYDINDGGGWNGTWLDATVSANLTGISVDPGDGVKLKIRFTATAVDSNITAFAFHTTTTIADQKANFHPIDQDLTEFTLLNLVIGSKYEIYNIDTSSVITSGIAASSTINYSEVGVANDTNIRVRVRSSSSGTKYFPFETSAVVAGLVVNVWVSQVKDLIAG